ncbi:MULTISPECIES: T9SS type A sorting domain-containing protein [Winogradskyella]|uniref:T9SS type A sorting domain-containing protein n=1 Tax=Winogradskyella TaxID=286104 RepID=UPI0015C9B432|nr:MULTISPECIES: T9SS type A sorting domain-containing protein [Winogradskyella]QXP78909.1 T9SS type A sorting domain-containing protein [Winogradskyella sp. HaHa_3_26]
MKRTLLFIFLAFMLTINAQVEQIDNVSVGAYVDHTIVPLSPQSNLSHSQTIYYKEQLEFRGYISEISYFTVFSNYTQTNVPVDPANLTIKLGVTNLEEFDSTTSFVANSELTEMTGVLRSTSVYEIRYTFETPFYYDGAQHLVVDVEDLNSGASQSATDGYRGVENFGNPPKRSMISLTSNFDDGTSQTSILKINSYPQTKFYGDLERCALVYVSDHENVTANSAEAILSYNDNVEGVRYNITESGEDIPEIYETTTEASILFTNLLPAQNYNTNVKSDCDEVSSSFNSRLFTTRPIALTVPHTINFEGDFNRDYIIPSYGAELLEEGVNNTSGLVFYGLGYPEYLGFNDSGDPYQYSNKSFSRTLSLDVDLTENAISPVLKFDLKQTYGTFLRIKIKDFGDDSYYTDLPEEFIYSGSSNDDGFKTITIDLSDYVGEMATIKLEHMSSSFSRKTYIDNVKLIENDCEKITNISSESTLNSISLNWDATTDNSYETVSAEFADNISVDYNEATTNTFTFNDLEPATAYKLFVRNSCLDSESPWQKIYASTDPEFLEVGFNEYFDESSLTNGKFSIINRESSSVDIITYYLSEAFAMFQRDSDAEWVGGETVTEAQVWNDNKDFITGLKFRIDGTTISEGTVGLSFKLQHHAVSIPQDSWFRILVNGTQVGPSYNPETKNSDALTTVSIDLEPYLGDVIEFELQQAGRYKGDFELSAISGDGTILNNLNFTGEILSVDQFETSSAILYPNPAESYVTINNLKTYSNIKVLDVNGKVINTTWSENDSTTIDVSQFSTGLYFIEIKNNNLKQMLKFIKR